MKKYVIYFIIIGTTATKNMVSCPCEFSSNDKRPFFEQYETPTNSPTTTQEEEKKP
ncbi:MAG TPA: hypothetical protein VLB80_02520 [Candidatus Babeliales bacterium]|nr:hypothetical protein [Candidatus Babeliales bacterium]